MTEEQFVKIIERCGFEPTLDMRSKYMNDPLIHALIYIINEQNEVIERFDK